jgi:NAD(P)-dependent dehydrogenase (short-subunit alcohol dehydrogenase family)
MSKTSALDDPARKVDPRHVGHKPPHEKQEKVPVPGKESQMNPKPDHGEDSYRGLGRLKDKVALITGSDSGIGRATAIAYAREGADVCIGYLNEEEEDARETERWVKEAGRKALLLPGDVRDEEHCRQMIEQTFKQFGKLDVLINNAAFQMTHESIEEFSTEEFDRTFKTNVYAMFWLCKFAIPRMEPGSVIINTASIQSFDPSPNLLAYASTKGAIVNFTKGLAKMVSKQGIRVNAVAPGPVWTPLIPSTMPDEKVKKFGSDTAFGRAAQPRELAPLYVFLASNESNYVTGEVYGATGGQTPY